MTYHIDTIGLSAANRFITQFHRHNKKVVGGKLCLGIWNEEELVGVSIAGRPISRVLDGEGYIEILRNCVKEGNKNANSMLYARMRRVLEAIGYDPLKIITYTLKTESGSSLLAIGATVEAETRIRPTLAAAGGNRHYQLAVYETPKLRWNLGGKSEVLSKLKDGG